MRGKPSVWVRAERLARAAPRPGDLDAVVRLIAAETGAAPEAVLGGGRHHRRGDGRVHDRRAGHAAARGAGRRAPAAGGGPVTRLGKRLAMLATKTPVGCPTCRRWSGVVYADDAGSRSRPERCPGCGRLVPVRLVRVVIGVPLEAV